MTSPRNEKRNSSFFLLNVRAQASRGLSLGCALLMTNAIWRVTTWIWLIWLVEAIFRRGTNQRVLCVRRRRTQSIPQGAVTNVVARLPSMLRRFLPDSSDSFGWSHICAVFVAILNFTLWGNAHARFLFTWSIASPKQSVTRIKPAPEVIRGCWKLVRYQKKI